ncbi:hypothetical protein Bbelb_132380 [Branchiostoma belcheri]|nr:hypothetical protein Bbelb_132380 [Branchiostoma belcheri]
MACDRSALHGKTASLEEAKDGGRVFSDLTSHRLSVHDYFPLGNIPFLMAKSTRVKIACLAAYAAGTEQGNRVTLRPAPARTIRELRSSQAHLSAVQVKGYPSTQRLANLPPHDVRTTGLLPTALSTYEEECGKVKHTALPADQPPAVVPCTTVCRPRATEMDMGTKPYALHRARETFF